VFSDWLYLLSAISSDQRFGIARVMEFLMLEYDGMTGLASWIFVMAFLLVYTALLLDGTRFDITATVVACLIGIVAWAGFLDGFLIETTSLIERILLAGVFLIGTVLALQLARRKPAAHARHSHEFSRV